MDIKFLTQENEIQKLYSKFGLVVPVGDLSNTKAPAVSVNNITILDEPFYYPEETEPVSQRTAEFELNVLTGAPEYNIEMCAYPKSVIDNCSEFQDGVVPTDFDLDDAINNPDSQSCLHTANAAIFATPSQRGYNHYKAPFYDGSDYGEYILIVSSYNYTEPYPFYTTTYSFNYEAPANWATPDEVLLGNKYIGEDGQEHTGTMTGGPENQAILEYSLDLFPYYYDYYTQQEMVFPWKCTVICDIPQDAGLVLTSFNVYFNYVEGDQEASDLGGSIYFESSTTIVGNKLVLTGFCRDSLQFSDWCNKYSPSNNMVAELMFDPIDTTAPDAQSVVVTVPCTFSAELYETPDCTQGNL